MWPFKKRMTPVEAYEFETWKLIRKAEHEVIRNKKIMVHLDVHLFGGSIVFIEKGPYAYCDFTLMTAKQVAIDNVECMLNGSKKNGIRHDSKFIPFTSI